ncbi:MAG: tRNA (N(6)-L-threonylcarbamoyladenosine(37)-C(2))-methylthiotransferase [Candidatus Diapherotrites archaeon]|uniref:tRNA-t(6)A37 methylthiotransferase n=1 Tax=Candidatus Iainarchaeum sp. TaxID=3101447 RepID=A0A938YYV7_9ARCH|nr:tRNA (N(6)-L-threonylcarbamoyladenosine(37)-C(2))-methylthiotransferase [Candidatus Diapherotrites archaeon]
MRAFIEGYGCSLNRSDTEQIQGLLKIKGFSLVKEPEKAGLLIINTCAVKEQTESKMLRRIKELNAVSEKCNSTLIVFGCLPKINPAAVSKVSPGVIQIGPSLEGLSSFLGLQAQAFSPNLAEEKSSPFVSIIPIARGCLGNCSYCAVRNARGQLKSYSISELNRKFKKAVKETPEIWLTAQDTGCYGKDIGSSLPELLKGLLKRKGNFRVRVGMVNPSHLISFLDSYLSLFSDERLYRFFHIPLQSGSNQILKAMSRPYTRAQFIDLVKRIRGQFPDAVIATDVIVGFPGETEKQFRETVSALKETCPDVVNISRFGARPNTPAALMWGQLHGGEKKKRSRILTDLCREISLERNRLFVGEKQKILVTERGPKGNFVGRNQNYKPVVVRKNLLGKFAEVKIKGAFPTYLLAVPCSK